MSTSESGSTSPFDATPPIAVGVVGCGYWGPKHVRVLDSMAGVGQVVAIDVDDAARKEVTKKYTSVIGLPDVESALPIIDALVVATPPRTHAPIALSALRAGKHVLVEKPFATSSEEAIGLIREAEAQGVTLMTGHTFEYNAAVWRLREAVQSGELGDVYYLDTARLNLGLYQPDVNVMWDLAPHDISILNYVLGSRPTEVSAIGHSFAKNGFEDVAYLNLEYGDIDAEAHVHVSWLDPSKVRRVTVVGSLKMAVYNDVATEEKIRVFDKGVGRFEAGGGDKAPVPLSYRYGDIVSPYVEFREPLLVQDEHFVHCINTGEQPATDGESGLAIVAVLEAAEQSMREQRPIKLEPRVL